MDIACNDGTQLDCFKKNGYETYGIDPAENLYPLSSKNHKIICDYLTKESVSEFNKKFDEYVEKQSFNLDIKILWMTFLNVIQRKGISADGHVTMEEFKG